MDTAAEGLTGIVLAGGAGARLGMPKAFLTLRGRPAIDRIVDRLRPICDEFIIVVSTQIRGSRSILRTDAGEASPSPGKSWAWPTGAAVVSDRIDGKGPLGGIATGLAEASRPWAFVTSCDAPFITSRLVRLLLRHSAEADVVVPERDGRLQPLLALYRQEAGIVAERRLGQDQLKMMDFLKDRSLRVYTVEESEWLANGIHPMTFTNVNTAGERADAERWISDPKNVDLLQD